MKILANNLKRFKVITFDVTNTILYFKSPPHVQYLKTAAEFGLAKEKFDVNLMKVNFRKQFKEMSKNHPNYGQQSIQYQKWWEQLVTNVFLNSCNESLDPQSVEPVVTKLIHQYKTRECWAKFSHTNELISEMKKLGKVVGAISNFDPRLHHLLADMELPDLDFVVTSYEAGAEKPNPEIFHYAMKLSGQNADASEALHIGNEYEKDFVGAQNAKWSSVLINTESKTDAEHQFKDIEEFWNVIKSQEINI